MAVAAPATVAPLASTDEYVCVRLSQLAVGSRLRSPVYDGRPGQQKQLLLSAGKQLAPSYLDNLQRRGIQSVLIHRNDWQRISENERSRQNKKRTLRPRHFIPHVAKIPATQRGSVAPGWSGWKIEGDSFVHEIHTPELARRDPLRMQQFQHSYEAGLKCTVSLIQLLVQEQQLNTDAAIRLSEQHLREVAEDLDEFLHRGVSPISSDYPSRHSLQTAMLATSMGAIMGFGREELLELGCGCLLHDAGMLMVPSHLLLASGTMSAADRLEIQKHPIYSANLIQERRDVPHGARHVVYQMHERMNGSGYPRGRSGLQIHPLARIAAVADTFLALVSPRPFRAALRPYEAVERILFAARQGLFDPSPVRALLHTISLFPIGSFVTLSNGQTAQVLRANREDFTRPKVQLLDPLGMSGEEEVIDLSEERKLIVVASADPPTTTTETRPISSPELLAAAASL
ncbi:MAG: HD domain-containing phosphohydrolase [Planctomycetaceae bacterium]|nr:HD domain-containing phosphohydrolase [Planctomycetaceae bacterium]